MNEQEEAEYSAWLDQLAADHERQEQETEQCQHEAICAALAINREVYA